MDAHVVIPPGIYRGTVDGIESGHCTARIEVRSAPGGCVAVDYEAVSDEFGLQHVEHALVGPDSLHVAFGEAAGVTVFRRISTGVFESDEGMRIVVEFSGDVLTWAWHWGSGPDDPDDPDDIIERSRAVCRPTTC
ncbi:hypothetical protein GCM10027062_27880 [Nocardioides hungaricus]